MYSEKRKTKRAVQDRALSSRIIIEAADQGVNFEAPCKRILDLSETGMRISADVNPRIGASVKVLVKLPRGDSLTSISLPGQVSWSARTEKGAEIGIKLHADESADFRR